MVNDGRFHVVLAVDRDVAGDECRARNQALDVMIPPEPFVDWNEMLKFGAKLSDYGLDKEER